MGKYIVLFIVFLWLNHLSYGQDNISKNKVIQQIEKTRKVFYLDIKKANQIIDSAIGLAFKDKLDKELAQAYNVKGFILYAKGKTDSAIIYYNKSEVLGNKLGDIIIIGRAKQNKGSAYNTLGKYPESLELLIQALKIYEKANDKSLIVKCYTDIANTLIRQNNSKEAINYLIKSIALAEELNDQRTILIALNSLGVAYENIQQWEKAKSTYLTAVELAKKQNNSLMTTLLYINLGKVSRTLLDKEGGTAYYLKAEEIAKKNDDKVRLALIYQNLGRDYYNAEKYDKALTYTLAAKNIAQKNGDQHALEKMYSSLADIYHKLGQHGESYFYSLKKDTLSKELYNAEALEKINEINVKYQTEKRQSELALLNKQNQIQSLELNKSKLENLNKKLLIDQNNSQITYQSLVIHRNEASLREKELQAKNDTQQIALLNKQATIQQLKIDKRNQTIAIISGLFLLSAIIGYLLFNRRKLQQEAKLKEIMALQQNQATRAVIEAEENERKRIASDLHDGVGQLLSVVNMNLSVIGKKIYFEDDETSITYGNTIKTLNESYNEMRNISHQMMPNALMQYGLSKAIHSFIQAINPEVLTIDFNMGKLRERYDSSIEIMLYRVLQECVNNVIKHANAKNISIQLEEFDDQLICTIEDDGKGFDLKEKADGIGLKNIQSRILFINGKLEISSRPALGTLISINIPLNAKNIKPA